jgi:hypothetical protein
MPVFWVCFDKFTATEKSGFEEDF